MDHGNAPVVKIEEFEGPFDLLLELIRAHKLDISTVNLADITDDFLKATELDQTISVEQQADFARTAALLLVMKLRCLLPDLTAEEEDVIDDLSWRVRIYALYREQAKKWQEQWGKYPLLPGPLHLHLEAEPVWPQITGNDLAHAFVQMRDKLPTPLDKRRHLRPQGKRVQECLATLRRRLQEMPQVWFSEIIRDADHQTVATSLLAALELEKNNQAKCQQEQIFGEIEIKAVKSEIPNHYEE